MDRGYLDRIQHRIGTPNYAGHEGRLGGTVHAVRVREGGEAEARRGAGNKKDCKLQLIGQLSFVSRIVGSANPMLNSA